MRLVGAVLKEISRLGHGQLVCFWLDVEMFTKCCVDIGGRGLGHHHHLRLSSGRHIQVVYYKYFGDIARIMN